MSRSCHHAFLADALLRQVVLRLPAHPERRVAPTDALQGQRHRRRDADAHYDQRTLLNTIKRSHKRESQGSETEGLDDAINSKLLVLDDLRTERLTDWVKPSTPNQNRTSPSSPEPYGRTGTATRQRHCSSPRWRTTRSTTTAA